MNRLYVLAYMAHVKRADKLGFKPLEFDDWFDRMYRICFDTPP